MIQKIDIGNTVVVNSIRSKMEVATVSDNGLMPAGIMGWKQIANSILICESIGVQITGSILLSVSNITGGMPALYFIGIGRSLDGGNPSVRVKIISGTYNIKIKAKTDASGVCRIYAERLEYTPIFYAHLMARFGIALKMTEVDNREFEGSFEATIE